MRLATVTLFALVAPLAACGSDDPDGYDDVVLCDQEPSKDDFVVGLTKPGEAGIYDFSLMAFTPAPPAQGNNAWDVKVMSKAAAAPVTDAQLLVTPFMPKHQHGPGVDPDVTPAGNAGEYSVDPINLWMPGIWEVTIEVESAGGADQVVFTACIPS